MKPDTLTVLPIASRVRLHGDGPTALVTGIKIGAERHVTYDVAWLDSANALISGTVEAFEVEPVEDCPKLTLGFAGCRLVSPSPKVKK